MQLQRQLLGRKKNRKMKLFDAHSHYDDERFCENREELLAEIHKSGVEKIVSAGYSLEGSINGLKLALENDYIYTTAGISPNDLSMSWEEDIIRIDELISTNLDSKKILAVGEIGLDYHYDTDRKIQYEAFKRQIDMANKFELPIVIHTRDAVMDTLKMIKENPVLKKGMFHCCPLNRELVKEALKLGYYISVAGPATFKNSKNAVEILEIIPLEKMLIETDSPYLAPEPVRGTRNDSRNLKYIVTKIAEVKGEKSEKVAKITYDNAMKFFGIKE